jgi:hypothetical protein
MTPTEADELGKRIINAWKSGPPLTEWREELQALDTGQAGTAFVRLKRTLEHAPTIARFLAEYRSLETHDASNPEMMCGWCSNSGWVASESHYEHKGHAYTAAMPCANCSHGRVAAESQTWQKARDRRPITETEVARLNRKEPAA